MMRLPARLSARLAKAGIARILNKSALASAIQWIDAAEVLHPGSAAPVSYEKMQSIVQSRGQIIWIGGSEPLVHSGIAHFVRAIAQSGHHVFIETNGTHLRRRIHEFQPLPQVFLVVRLGARRDSQFDLAVEGLRAARLSGFFTAVHSLVTENSDLAELARLRFLLEGLDVDGWMISAESAHAIALSKAAEARGLIPAIFWRQFSKLVEEKLLPQLPDAPTPASESPHVKADEEGVKVA